jgi:hypothetical protein
MAAPILICDLPRLLAGKKKNKREKDPGKNHGANPFVSYQEKNLKTEKKQKEAERSRSLKKSKKEV